MKNFDQLSNTAEQIEIENFVPPKIIEDLKELDTKPDWDIEKVLFLVSQGQQDKVCDKLVALGILETSQANRLKKIDSDIFIRLFQKEEFADNLSFDFTKLKNFQVEALIDLLETKLEKWKKRDNRNQLVNQELVEKLQSFGNISLTENDIAFLKNQNPLVFLNELETFVEDPSEQTFDKAA